MELDFSVLNTIENEAPASPIDDFKPIEGKSTQQEQQKPVEGLYDALIDTGLIKPEAAEQPKIYSKIELEKQAAEQKRRALELKAEISKNIAAAGDPAVILLKAIECISFITEDRQFYENNKEKIEQITFLG